MYCAECSLPHMPVKARTLTSHHGPLCGYCAAYYGYYGRIARFLATYPHTWYVRGRHVPPVLYWPQHLFRR
jgi:hypothetical protein